MRPPAAFRPTAGAHGPRQGSRVSCGAACLVVATMLNDADFAAWIAADPARRFPAAERTVMSRTNGLAPRPGVRQIPWPRFWGTPPWGVKTELEAGAACPPGTRYEYVLLRGRPKPGLRRALRTLQTRVRPAAPALAYVGARTLPRHVVLVFRDAQGPMLVYEPFRGRVLPLSVEAFGRAELDLGGWSMPWLLVQPRAQQPARAAVPGTVALTRARARRLAAGET